MVQKPVHQPQFRPTKPTKPNKPTQQKRNTQQEPRNRSQRFEDEVYNLIKQVFPTALQHVYVRKNEHQMSEIDILLVHTSGIYIFEVKRKKGYIVGEANATYWRQMTRDTRDSFYNPLRQTMAQINRLSSHYRILPSSCHSFIVFNDGSDIDRVRFNSPRHTVCRLSELHMYLMHITNNTATPISPFILEDIHYDLAHSNTVRNQQAHKQVLRKRRSNALSPRRRQNTHP